MTVTHTAPRTFRGPAGTGAPRLAGLPGVVREEAAPSEIIEIERYDTDDRRLATAGITLARHNDGDSGEWRLDLPDGDTAERLRVPGGAGRDVPGELLELVRGASRERAVGPAGRIRTMRAETALFDDEGRVVATIVFDEIAVATLGRTTEVEAWTEVVLHGSSDAIEERLAEAGLRPAPRSADAELDRLLRPAARPRAAGRKSSATRLLHEQLATQVERLAAEDLRVRRGEPDAAHRIRVSARRLRSLLRTYRPLLDRDRTEPIIDALREL